MNTQIKCYSLACRHPAQLNMTLVGRSVVWGQSRNLSTSIGALQRTWQHLTPTTTATTSAPSPAAAAVRSHFWGRRACATSPEPTSSSLPSPAALSSPTSPPPAEIGETCLRCTVFDVSGDTAEQLGDILLAMGAQSVVVSEHRPVGAPEQEIFDDGGEAPLWDRCDLVAHFPLEADVDSTVQLAVAALEEERREAEGEGEGEGQVAGEGGPYEYRIEPIKNESWAEQIMASYVPVQVAQDLWIIPEWSEPADPGATNIVLQPGIAFGTGEHPTTRLCLRELRDMAARGQLAGVSVCDYGTGSGVLAIAALKYGAARAVGTDIDSLAVRAAERNGLLNGFEPPAFSVLRCGAGIDEEEPLAAAAAAAAESASGTPTAAAAAPPAAEFDLVVANILRGPLVELQPRLAGYVRPGGRLVLSGILYEQAAEIREAYGADFQDFAVKTDQQWAVLTATKRARREGA